MAARAETGSAGCQYAASNGVACRFGHNVALTGVSGPKTKMKVPKKPKTYISELMHSARKLFTARGSPLCDNLISENTPFPPPT